MTKAHVTAAFLLGGSLIGGNALAAEPLVEIIHAGASVGTYANFDAGMKAAAPGDVEVHATNVVFKTCGFAADSGGQTLRGSATWRSMRRTSSSRHADSRRIQGDRPYAVPPGV